VLLTAVALSSMGARAAAPVPAQVTTVKSIFLPGDDDVPQLALTVTRGGTLTFTNLDPTGYHNLVEKRASGSPRFQSLDPKGQPSPLGPGDSGSVQGISSLAAGTYHFVCLLHPDMLGTLTIS
jgi:plastocyanin